jgi:hypothetical protein
MDAETIEKYKRSHEGMLRRCKTYREKHSEEIKLRKKEYHEKNREALNEISRQNYLKRKAKKAEILQTLAISNPPQEN